MTIHTKPTTLGKPSPRDERDQVRIRDYYTGETIYLADRLHDGWQQEVEIYIGYRADITREETDDGFVLIRADDDPVGYIGDHPDLPMNSWKEMEAAE